MCISCKELKSLNCFEHNGNSIRNTCKECRNKQAKELRIAHKREDIVMYKCREMAYSAYARVFAPSREYKTTYRNLIDPFGFESQCDLKMYIYNNYYNIISEMIENNISPSIDRKDINIGYTKENIRIIDVYENTLLCNHLKRRKIKMTTPNNEEIIFESMADCCEYFGFNRTSTSKIRDWILNTGQYKKPTGYIFKYVS